MWLRPVQLWRYMAMAHATAREPLAKRARDHRPRQRALHEQHRRLVVEVVDDEHAGRPRRLAVLRLHRERRRAPLPTRTLVFFLSAHADGGTPEGAGSDREGGVGKKGLGRGASLGTFGSDRALGVRRRRAPRS